MRKYSRIICLLSVLALFFVFAVGSESSSESMTGSDSNSKPTVTVLANEDEFIGLDKGEVEGKLREMGFSSFEYNSQITDQQEEDGLVYDVLIRDGILDIFGQFTKGDTFPLDAKVTIYHYVYKEPDKPSPVYYSTNDYETAKEGKTGVFSYKKSGKAYDLYWIIDFDEGYVYHFAERDGNTWCERLKIESGTLNDRVVITYHDGDDVWSYGLYFKYVNSPTLLIMQDNDGFVFEYSPTDLDEALTLRDAKTIKDY